MSAKPPSRALDFATRNLIAETIKGEFLSLSMAVQQVPVPQLHGPESLTCETFVIGCVLAGVVALSDVPLLPSDFWARLHARVWQTLLDLDYSVCDGCDIEAHCRAVGAHAVESGRLGDDLENYAAQLWLWADMSEARVALYDVASAVAIIREHARARRLVAIMARLCDDICAKRETHDSAYAQLRDYFRENRA